MAAPPHNIALLPPPGFLGHLIPFIELAKLLVSHHNCTVSLIIPHDGSHMEAQRSLLHGTPSTINPIFLPPVPVDDLPDNTAADVLLTIRMIRSLPSLRQTLSGTPAAALVVDLFAPHAVDVAREFGIPAFIYYVIAASELALSIDICTSECIDLAQPMKLPGNLVVNPSDFPDLVKHGSSEDHKLMLDVSKKYLLADGILVNSFLELEWEAFRQLRRPGLPPVYPVGPLIRAVLETESECLKWLNDQPSGSVLYVSFGSGGTLTVEQFRELAFGLEISQQRFLWVMRSPSENIAAAYLSTSQSNPLDYLPQGFLERTRHRGLVVASWAPQIQVLGHSSTGGFLSHCGWNSILESAVFGVPMMAWPLLFEQKMNAVLLTDGVKGAVRVRENENGIVERGHISEAIKQLMEGEEGRSIRERMMELKTAARNARCEEGSSTQALAQAVKIWTNRT